MKKPFFLVLIVALLVGTTTVLAGPPAGVPRGRPQGASPGSSKGASPGPPEGVPPASQKGVSHSPPEWASSGSPKGASPGPPDKGNKGLNGPAGNSRGAGKAPLYDSGAYDCEEGATDTDDAFGFVIMNTNADGVLIVQVSLKGATANVTYDIWVNQYPGACDPGLKLEAVLTTNIRGNGNAHVQVARHPDAENFWVSATGGDQVLRSTAVTPDWTDI